ncbi:MAG: HEAT repeat domain-containing protein [Candidatus Omnitrophica bacterium]|nr:HEAT repeat domain-containing protein [Candidatus Omnitrophota bacterium]
MELLTRWLSRQVDPSRPDEALLVRVLPRSAANSKVWQDLQVGLEPLLTPQELSGQLKAYPADLLYQIRVESRPSPTPSKPPRRYLHIPIRPSLKAPGYEPLTELVLRIPSAAAAAPAAGVEFSDLVEGIGSGRANAAHRKRLAELTADLLKQGDLLLENMPLGLRTEESRDLFASEVGVDPGRLLWEDRMAAIQQAAQRRMDEQKEQADSAGRRDEAARRVDSITQRINLWADQEIRAPLRERLEAVREHPLSSYLDPDRIRELSGQIKDLPVRAAVESQVSRGLPEAKGVEQVQAGLRERGKRIEAAIDRLPSDAPAGAELDRVVARLGSDFGVEVHGRVEGSPEDPLKANASLQEVFLNQEVRRNYWSPFRVAEFLTQFRQVKEIVRKRLPDLPWFSDLVLEVPQPDSPTRNYLTSTLYMPAPPTLGFMLNLAYPTKDASYFLGLASYLVSYEVGSICLRMDPDILFDLERQGVASVILQGLPHNRWLKGPLLADPKYLSETGFREFLLGELVGTRTLEDMVKERVAFLLSAENPEVVAAILWDVEWRMNVMEARSKSRGPLDLFLKELKDVNLWKTGDIVIAGSDEKDTTRRVKKFKQKVQSLQLRVFGRLANDMDILPRLAILQAIVSMVPGPSPLAGRLKELSGQILADLEATSPLLPEDPPRLKAIREADWRRIYPEFVELYRRLADGLEIRSPSAEATGLEEVRPVGGRLMGAAGAIPYEIYPQASQIGEAIARRISEGLDQADKPDRRHPYLIALPRGATFAPTIQALVRLRGNDPARWKWLRVVVINDYVDPSTRTNLAQQGPDGAVSEVEEMFRHSETGASVIPPEQIWVTEAGRVTPLIDQIHLAGGVDFMLVAVGPEGSVGHNFPPEEGFEGDAVARPFDHDRPSPIRKELQRHNEKAERWGMGTGFTLADLTSVMAPGGLAAFVATGETKQDIVAKFARNRHHPERLDDLPIYFLWRSAFVEGEKVRLYMDQTTGVHLLNAVLEGDLAPGLSPEKASSWLEHGDAASDLGRIGPAARPGVRALTRLLQGESPAPEEVREQAAWALGQIGPEAFKAVPVLSSAVRSDGSSRVRREATAALGRIGGPQAAHRLAEIFANYPDREIRGAAVTGLARMNSPTLYLIQTLLRALRDPDSDVRWAAVSGLGNVVGQASRLSPRKGELLRAVTRRALERFASFPDPVAGVNEAAGKVLKQMRAGLGETGVEVLDADGDRFRQLYGRRLNPFQHDQVASFLSNRVFGSIQVIAVTGRTLFTLHADPAIAREAKKHDRGSLEGVAFDIRDNLRDLSPGEIRAPGLIASDKDIAEPYVKPEGVSVRAVPVSDLQMRRLKPVAWMALAYNPRLQVDHLLDQQILLITLQDEEGTVHLIFSAA